VEMASPATSLNTPLAAMHAASGAKVGVWLGCAMPDDFGDPAAEYRYARDTVALIDKTTVRIFPSLDPTACAT